MVPIVTVDTSGIYNITKKEREMKERKRKHELSWLGQPFRIYDSEFINSWFIKLYYNEICFIVAIFQFRVVPVLIHITHLVLVYGNQRLREPECKLDSFFREHFQAWFGNTVSSWNALIQTNVFRFYSFHDLWWLRLSWNTYLFYEAVFLLLLILYYFISNNTERNLNK